MDFLACEWLWLYLGAFLMLAELAAPGFVIFFFGLAAASVGLCRFVFGEAFTGTWQLVAFSAFVVVYLVGLRRLLKPVFGGEARKAAVTFGQESVGRLGKVTAAVKPPLAGRVMIGDAEWTAVADAPLAEGANVVVIGQENLTMKIKEVE